MADTIRARAGDTLDGLLWRERGLGPEALPAVMAANRGIAGLGAVLPIGTGVTVPPAASTAPATRELVQLWS
jgi:phage tail protein X